MTDHQFYLLAAMISWVLAGSGHGATDRLFGWIGVAVFLVLGMTTAGAH